MGLSYYDYRTKPQTHVAMAFLVVNATITFVMIFYWSGMAGLIADPFRWAMRDGVSVAPTIFEYPYLTLWLTPLLCMCGGWLAIKAERFSMARIVGIYPSLMLAIMTSWYYLTPPHWH